MKQLTESNLKDIIRGELGLSANCELDSMESISGILRRAAAFLCPCPSKTLLNAARQALAELVSNEILQNSVEEALEAIISYGDIFEFRAIDTYSTRSLLYNAPLSFVNRGSGQLFIIGIGVDRPRITGIDDVISYSGVSRRVPDSLKEDLIESGFIDLSQDVWLKTPPKETPLNHIQRVDHLLEKAPVSGEIEDLLILDGQKNTMFYADRWVAAKSQTGRFVARRPQSYGNNLWSYVELKSGKAVRLLDLPINTSRNRGCDEAWQLQLAIDAASNRHQVFRVGHTDHGLIEFFMPIPKWARRRFDIIGNLMHRPGSLLAYSFHKNEIDQEVQFLNEMLWMKATS